MEQRAEVPVPEPARSFATPSVAVSVAPATPVVTDTERARFALLADALLPGDERMPGATDVGVAHDCGPPANTVTTSDPGRLRTASPHPNTASSRWGLLSRPDPKNP